MNLISGILTQTKERRYDLAIQTMSSMRRDFIASHLRSQMERLSGLLRNIENEDRFDLNYGDESLRRIEINLRQIRKSCLSN